MPTHSKVYGVIVGQADNGKPSNEVSKHFMLAQSAPARPFVVISEGITTPRRHVFPVPLKCLRPLVMAAGFFVFSLISGSTRILVATEQASLQIMACHRSTFLTFTKQIAC